MRRFAGIALLALLLGCRPVDDGAGAAAEVSEANLLESERFWPYQVALGTDGAIGVLIRVEDGGIARVDFGRDGLRGVPIAATDLVARANRIRRGELDKMAPNFVLAIGSRLIDSTGPKLVPYAIEAARAKQGFLCVFADPSDASFAELAKSLAPLTDRHGVTTILFPQGSVSDATVREKLRALGWTVPFVYGHLSEAYTRTLLPDTLKQPAVLLQTSEGRVLLASSWSSNVVPELTHALDAAYAATTAAAAGSPPL